MDFGLSDSQEALRRTFAAFLERHAPMDKVRQIMESESGCDPDLYRELAAAGFTSLLLSEELGGAGLGLLDVTIAAQELGRRVTPLSFHSSCVAASLLLASAEPELRDQWLGPLVEGRALVACSLDAVPIEDGRLEGTLGYVADGQCADAIVVPAADELFLFELPCPGISVEPLLNIDDTRRLAEIGFSGTKLASERRLMKGEQVAGLLELTRQAAQIALAADTLGACQEALRFAVDYALERRQFDRTIGSFQAVKHMCAEVAAAIEPLQSLVWYSAFAWDENRAEVAHLAPLVKAHAAEVGTQAVTLTTQVMGGIGFTWECDMHLWFKRVGYDRQVLGSPDQLRTEAAKIQLGA